jgi:hypothetical protein
MHVSQNLPLWLAARCPWLSVTLRLLTICNLQAVQNEALPPLAEGEHLELTGVEVEQVGSPFPLPLIYPGKASVAANRAAKRASWFKLELRGAGFRFLGSVSADARAPQCTLAFRCS